MAANESGGKGNRKGDEPRPKTTDVVESITNSTLKHCDFARDQNPRTSSTNISLVARKNQSDRSIPYFDERQGSPWSKQNDEIVLGPYKYLFDHPGKDVRSNLIAGFNMWLNVPAENVEVIINVIGMLHTASLLVDDVEDSSQLRRGIPVAHHIFGIAQTINSANYVYFLALAELRKLRSPEAVNIFTEEMLNLHRGQGMDLHWRDSLTCPSIEEYIEMVSNKTGGLFRLAIKLMQAESLITIECTPLVSCMSILFQILDDYQNLLSLSYTIRKGYCEDLSEGKFSFPIIHAIQTDLSNRVLISILSQRTSDEKIKQYAVNYMKSKGTFAFTSDFIDRLRDSALAMIDELTADVDRLGGQAELGREHLKAIVNTMRVD